MDLITWNDEQMNTGLELIDIQHKKLCGIINSFANALDNEGKEETLEIIEHLIEYTKYHFLEEEKYFDQFEFEQKDFHKSEHAYFIDYFGELKDIFENEKEHDKRVVDRLARDMLKYLIEWFVTHISGTDREYVELFKKKGII